MNKIILNRVNLDGFKLNPIGKQVDKKDFEYLVIDREFKFDKTAGGKTIKDGTARIETIKGNSVVWNQLINETYLEAYDATITKTDTGYTIMPTGNAPGLRTNTPNGNIIPIVGHKYAIICEKVGGSKAMYLNWGGFNASLTSPIITATDATKIQLTIHSYQETEPFTMTTPRLYDLTKMFGAGNEPTTIEEFNARIPSGIDEYAYNEGEVIHMDVQSLESVGVNQWGGELEEGKIQSGEEVFAQGMARSIGYINIIPNTAYYATCKYMFYPYFYDEDKNYIGTPKHVKTFTTPPNARYLRFFLYNSSGTVELDTQVCINLSDPSINGKYFPYVKREQNLDIIGKYFPNGMKSAVAAHDEIRFNKATQKWEKVVRIGVAKMKDLNWRTPSADVLSFSIFNAPVADMRLKETSENETTYRKTGLICSRYSISSTPQINADMEDKSIFRQGAAFGVVLRDTTYTTIADFVASLTDNDVIIYELAEPIVTEIEETINLDYPVWNVGTEKAVADTPSTPLKADIRYKILKNKLKLMTLNI